MHGLTMVAMALALAANAAAAGVKIDDKAIDAKTDAYEISVRYPQTGVKAIDEDIAGWIEREVATFKQEAAPEPESAAGAWTLDIGYTVERNDDHFLAVLFSLSSYTGGAHGSHGFLTRNFLLPDGAHVDLAQVLDGSAGLARLSTLAVADLKKQLLTPDGMTDADWIQRGAGPAWSNFETFLLLPDALRLEFPQYQVAAYAAGPQQVTVPLSALSGVLRKDLRAPAASFDCSKAATVVERAICADSALAQLDRELAATYGQRLDETDAASDKDVIRAAQRAWLQQRNTRCKAESGTALTRCLGDVYRARLAEFSAAADAR